MLLNYLRDKNIYCFLHLNTIAFKKEGSAVVSTELIDFNPFPKQNSPLSPTRVSRHGQWLSFR